MGIVAAVQFVKGTFSSAWMGRGCGINTDAMDAKAFPVGVR